MNAVFAKIISFIMSILAFLGLVKPFTPTAELDNYAVKDGAVEFCLSANATTGYQWNAEILGDCVRLTDSRYVQDDNPGGLVGVGGRQYFEFAAVKAGTATVTFTYSRASVSPDDKVVTALLTVDADRNITVTAFSTK